MGTGLGRRRYVLERRIKKRFNSFELDALLRQKIIVSPQCIRILLFLASMCHGKNLIHEQRDANSIIRPSASCSFALFFSHSLPSFRVTHVHAMHTPSSTQSVRQSVSQSVSHSLTHSLSRRPWPSSTKHIAADDDDRDLLYLRPNCLAL